METGLSTGALLVRALAVVLLIAANAFFVASEFALVASRRTRVEAMVRKGDRKAKTVQAALQDLYRQLSAAQLGITLASILLGYVAEDTVAVLLREWLAGLPTALAFFSRAAVASVVAVLVISFLHVVIGEQAPKAWAITYPEGTSRWIAAPLLFFSVATRPATNLLNWSANRLVRLMGLKSATAEQLEGIHSPEEIVMLLKQSQKSGRIAREDVKLIEGVFEFTEKSARDVMTPRTDVVALEEDLTVREAAAHVAQAGRSRYPVVRESLDDITGVVHAKQILAALQDHPQDRVASLMREPLFVPGTREVEDVLADMKRLKSHLAVVLDEFGGTAGIVTMEDLLEEIVGQIYDEYDRAEPAPSASGGAVTLPGSMEIAQANERYKLALSDEEYQTVGGFVFGTLGRLPHPGDRVALKNAALEVLEMDGRRVKRLKLVPQPSPAPPKGMEGDAAPPPSTPQGDGRG